MVVKIIKASISTLWYANHIEDVFNVTVQTNSDNTILYITNVKLKNPFDRQYYYGFIYPNDCEVISK